MYDIVIDPIITYIDSAFLTFRSKKPTIIYDLCGIINHIANKFMACGPTFYPPTTHKRVTQYNAKQG